MIQNRINRRRDVIEYSRDICYDFVDELHDSSLGFVVLIRAVRVDQSLSVEGCPADEESHDYRNCKKGSRYERQKN